MEEPSSHIVIKNLGVFYSGRCIKIGVVLLAVGCFLMLALITEQDGWPKPTHPVAHKTEIRMSLIDSYITRNYTSPNDINSDITNVIANYNKSTNDNVTDVAIGSRGIQDPLPPVNGKRATTEPSANSTSSYPPIDLEKHVPPLQEIFNRTVIITAASSNHFRELKRMVSTANKHMPHTKIILYDLGLNKKILKLISGLPNIMELRKLNFTKYPEHVKDLLNYAWKPPIIKETLYEFGAIFWADTSIRFKGSIFSLYRSLEEFHGYIPNVANYATTRYRFSTFNKTHPDMFRYLGVDRDNTYKNDVGYTPAIQGGRLLFVNSSYINDKLLQPWVDCAMVLQCIAPKGSQNPHRRRIPGQYVHRYDQSALSILMYKNLRGLFKTGHDASKTMRAISFVNN